MKNGKRDKARIGVVIMAAASLAMLWIVAVGVMIYGFGTSNRITEITSALIPYPAAIVGKDVITVGKLESQLAAARRFYENQDFSDLGLRVDFSTDQGEKRLRIKEKNILNKLVEISIIETEAKKRGIRITDKDVSEQVQSKMAEYGTEDSVKSDMKKLYGWSLSQFESNIVKPDLYREKLASDIRENDQYNKEAEKKAEDALSELDGGAAFADTARKYSDGDSAKNGGSLGWFTQDQMLPEIAKAVFLMNKGDRSAIISSSLGYHIILIEDKSSEDGVDRVKLSQVFIKARTLPEWLSEKERSVSVRISIKGVRWDKDAGGAVFADSDMNDFEDNLQRNSPDDVSVMF